MGTSLTGLTPSTTYDALIKVGDNGALSATAKYLSDGLGNDSPLSMSTSQVGIGTNTPNQTLTIGATNGYPVIDFENSNTAYGDIGFQVDKMVLSGYSTTPITLWTNGNERMRITSAGNVGIGTAAPNFILETAGTTGIGVRSTGVDGVYTDILSSVYSGNANEQNAIQASVSGVASDSGFRFQVSDGSGLSTQTLGYQMNKDRHIFYANGSERVRITTSGLTFNGDTSASNALDDYEEGTWTMGVSFGGGTTGITYSANTGAYTKIGRQVTVSGYLGLTSKGSSTGDAKVTGLPFTIANNDANYASPALRINGITFTNQFQGIAAINTTTLNLEEITILGVVTALTDADFANNSNIIVSLTYFV
jgi:hypothetical protein